jgi:very-long-chain enoyl-CoA reductase
MRLTVGTAKGRAVTDKRGVLKTLFKAEAGKDEIKLVFKDLGQQISWTTVFLVEYFGPILMTVLLAVFQK